MSKGHNNPNKGNFNQTNQNKNQHQHKHTDCGTDCGTSSSTTQHGQKTHGQPQASHPTQRNTSFSSTTPSQKQGGHHINNQNQGNKSSFSPNKK